MMFGLAQVERLKGDGCFSMVVEQVSYHTLPGNMTHSVVTWVYHIDFIGSQTLPKDFLADSSMKQSQARKSPGRGTKA